MSESPRHFLDLFDVPASELRTILDASVATSHSPTRRWR